MDSRSKPATEKFFDYLTNPETFFGWFARLLPFLVLVDFYFYNLRASVIVLQVAENNSSTISLLLTLSLVLLYFDQQQTQKKQTELIERQADIQEKQVMIDKRRLAPEIDVNYIDVARVEHGESPSNQPIIQTALVLHNQGKGKADDLKIDYEILLNCVDFDGYFPAHYLGISVYSDNPVDITTIDPEKDHPVDIPSHNRLNSDNVDGYIALNWVRYSPRTGPAVVENNDSEGIGQTFKIPNEKADRLGEALEKVEFEISDVIIRARLTYSDFSGEEHQRDLLHKRAEATGEITFEEIIRDGETTSDDLFSKTHPNEITSRYLPL